MKNSQLNLYIEINILNLIFFIGENDDQDKHKIIYKLEIPISGIDNNRVSNPEKVLNIIKENIYSIEQKYKITFKDIILILDNSNPNFINLSGYKILNGSQVLRENIIYIINTLKSYVDRIETKRKIIHIFNSKYYLDKKEIENLPIGLFGDFYSHDLSFALIDLNFYKNLKNIFDKSNLKIKKIYLKSFVKGAHLSKTNENIQNFFHIMMSETSSKIFYFENESLKFEQVFNFGTDIIINDIHKVTGLKINSVKKILDKIELKKDQMNENDLIEEEFLKDENIKKIKKKLLYEIALARVIELSDLIIFKNINLKYNCNVTKVIFLEIANGLQLQSLKEIYQSVFSNNGKREIKFIEKQPFENMVDTAYKLVHFGWKKEAIPISQPKKSIISKLFDLFFR